MDSEQRRKRKRVVRPPSVISVRFLVLCLLFLLFLVPFSPRRFRFPLGTVSFRPVLSVSLLSSSSSSSAVKSIHDSYVKYLPLRVEGRVVFPDHLLLLVSNEIELLSKKLDCVYYKFLNGSGGSALVVEDVRTRPVLSVDEYGGDAAVVRCPLPPLNFSAAVNLMRRGDAADNNWTLPANRTVPSWKSVAYAAALDGDTAVVFVKGLNLRPNRASDPSFFSCRFEQNDRPLTFTTTKAVAAAQEVVRCVLPVSIRTNRSKAHGIRVTVSRVQRFQNRPPIRVHLPSVAKIDGAEFEEVMIETKQKHELCVCTMAWNQAASIKEWIVYHAWLGVERWFIYDNNSDDEIKEVIEELNSENYNVSRHAWPWIKTQEAGFSHCTLRARRECNWVSFMDVDEFFHFQRPTPQHRGIGVPGQNSLRTLVSNYTTSTTIGELRTTCHSFGPSGLTSAPDQGVTAGYTCRLQRPERHKSIVRPDVLERTLLNVVHHFRLKKGFRYMNVPQSTAVINHYKYQVWDSFKSKFYRRVATYVVDWQENQNEGSRDRAPGLGTEAIEPPDWPLQFCEVWDNGLRDFVLANLADPATGLLPWERSSL